MKVPEQLPAVERKINKHAVAPAGGGVCHSSILGGLVGGSGSILIPDPGAPFGFRVAYVA